MLKAFLCSSSFFLLHSLSISQNLNLKGQLLASSITSNDVPDNWQAYESIFSYIPTLSFKIKNTTNELIDFEWAYKLNKYFKTTYALLDSNKKNYLVDHSSNLYVIDKNLIVKRIVANGLPSSEITKAVRKLFK